MLTADLSLSLSFSLQQLFIKLGVRYLAVLDERGCYLGIIEKNR